MALIILPDPCPHISRLGLIAARVRGTEEQQEQILGHIRECEDAIRPLIDGTEEILCEDHQ